MAIISEMPEERPSTSPFKASLDPSNPLGFLEKALDFIGKESNFLMKDTAEKEIAAAVTAAKERLKEAEKKKAERETVKPIKKKLKEEEGVTSMEVEKPKKESLKPEPMEVEKPKEEEKQESGPVGKSFALERPLVNNLV